MNKETSENIEKIEQYLQEQGIEATVEVDEEGKRVIIVGAGSPHFLLLSTLFNEEVREVVVVAEPFPSLFSDEKLEEIRKQMDISLLEPMPSIFPSSPVQPWKKNQQQHPAFRKGKKR